MTAATIDGTVAVTAATIDGMENMAVEVTVATMNMAVTIDGTENMAAAVTEATMNMAVTVATVNRKNMDTKTMGR